MKDQLRQEALKTAHIIITEQEAQIKSYKDLNLLIEFEAQQQKSLFRKRFLKIGVGAFVGGAIFGIVAAQ